MIREPDEDLVPDSGDEHRPSEATVAEHLIPTGPVELPSAASADEIEADLRSAGGTGLPDGSETEAALVALSGERLRSVLESLLFIADRPLTLSRLLEILEETASPDKASGPPLYKPQEVQAALTQLATELRAQNRGIELHEVAGGFQLRTAPANAPWVTRLLKQKPVRLSRAQTETLSIIAYRQPITRPEIDEIRGVDSGGALKTLLERNFIRILGKKEEPGRPLLYGTTKDFLEFFNLRDLKDLPTLREYYELSDEHKAKVRAEHGELPPPLTPSDAVSTGGPPSAADQVEGATPTDTALSEAPVPEVPAGPPPISRVEILDQQLADDAEALKKIDELINAVPMELTRPPGETPAEPDPNAAASPDGEPRKPPGRPGRPPKVAPGAEAATASSAGGPGSPADEPDADDEAAMQSDDETEIPDEEL